MERIRNPGVRASMLIFLAGISVACAGAEKSPDSSFDAREPSAPPTSSYEEQEGGAEEFDSEPGADEVSGPITAEDFQQALALVLQDEAMRTALNLEQPGRFPVKVAGSDIPSGLEIMMVGEPIEVVSVPEDPKTEAVLVFTRASLQGNTGSFKFRYDVEGMRGSSTVVRTEGRWELKSSRFSKY